MRCRRNGAIAQLGEHLPCTQGVSGSIPLSSTILPQRKNVRSKKTKTRSNKREYNEMKNVFRFIAFYSALDASGSSKHGDLKWSPVKKSSEEPIDANAL